MSGIGGKSYMTARDLAKSFIRYQVLRGDTIEQIAGYQGSSCSHYSVQIGGYIFNNFQKPNQVSKKLTSRQIGIEKVDGIECMEIFTLEEIYKEIRNEAKYGVQERLF